MKVLVFCPGTVGLIPVNNLQDIGQSGLYLEMALGLPLDFWVNYVKESVNFVSKERDCYCTVDRELDSVDP